MPTPFHGSARVFKWLLPCLSLLTLTSCLLVVSTSPTSVSNANIVFVAVDDQGSLVAALHISVFDVSGDWRVDGVTGRDGSFRCGVRSGVSRVRVEPAPPAGYVFADPKEWPRNLEVPSGGDVRIEIRVTGAR